MELSILCGVLSAFVMALIVVTVVHPQVMWLVYDFFYGNVVAGVFDVLTILSNVGGIWLIMKK